MKVTGKVLDVRKNEKSFSCCVHGIKKQKQGSYARNSNFHGSNGTYRMGYPEVHRTLNLVVKVRNYKHQFIDVRESFLRVNNRKKVTEKVLNLLANHIKNKSIEVDVISDGNTILLDESVLKL